MDKTLRERLDRRLSEKKGLTALSEALCHELALEQSFADPVERVLLAPHIDLSARLDSTNLQQSCSVRNVMRARDLASLLIDDQGALDQERLERAIDVLTTNLHGLALGRELDLPRTQHMLAVLQQLQVDKVTRQALAAISRPERSMIAEKLIRETLRLEESHQVTDADTRRAALSACLCYLRQNVGSCFATAPAIIVQTEKLHVFLQDVNELLSTERLQRVAQGHEYTAPLTTSWGIGDLRRPVLVAATEHESPQPLWEAPGLQLGLEAAGVDLSETNLKQLYFEALHKAGLSAGRRWMLVEDVFATLLRYLNDLDRSDIQDYETSLDRAPRRDLVEVAVQSATDARGVRKRCEHYFKQLDEATGFFKALTDNALLKAWEFTLASFAETKANFSRWNLYKSLGFDHREPDGLADCLYQAVQARLDAVNDEVKEQTRQLEQIQLQVEYTGQRMRRASSERELKFMQTEYQSRVSEFRHAETLRDLTHRKAKILASLHQVLLDQLDERFPSFFQEVYDPDMREVASGPYDDSPAGFRLLCKHGRSHAAQWTLIYTPQEFIDSLASFLVSVEHELLYIDELEPVRDEIGPIITTLVAHVKSQVFIESALHRMARAHGAPILEDPLKHLDKLPKKPWSYTSGGTMAGLVASYFGQDSKPTDSSRWVENPTELLCFIIDTVRAIPQTLRQQFVAGLRRCILMHSPTHAFNLLPNLVPFRDSWQDNDQYTYTWVRDKWVLPAQQFYGQIVLERDAIQLFLKELGRQLPSELESAYWTLMHSLAPRSSLLDLRNSILSRLRDDARFGLLNAASIDGLLFSEIPYTKSTRLRAKLEPIFSALSRSGHTRDLLSTYDELMNLLKATPLLSSSQVMRLCRLTFMAQHRSLTCAHNVAEDIDHHARQAGLIGPKPIRFADSNWVSDDFAFVINPASLKLELWRCHPNDHVGAPLDAWSHFLDGTQREPTWGIYQNPLEYTASSKRDVSG